MLPEFIMDIRQLRAGGAHVGSWLGRLMAECHRTLRVTTTSGRFRLAGSGRTPSHFRHTYCQPLQHVTSKVFCLPVT